MEYTLLKTEFLEKRKGWDVTARFTDEQQGVNLIKTFFHVGKEEPTIESMADHLAHLSSNIQDDLDTEEIKENFTREEVVDLLIEKKYLESGQDLDDLSIKEAVK